MPSSTFRQNDDQGGVERVDAALSSLVNGGDVESSIAALSDLSRPAARRLRERWLQLDEDVRLRVVREMILLHSDLTKDFERALLVGLDDPDQEIRLLAVEGLARAESFSVPLALAGRLQSDPAPRVREAIAHALGEVEWHVRLAERDEPRASELRDVLIERAMRDESYFVRCEALASAAWFDDERLGALIRDLYDEGDAEARVYAIRAMGRQASPIWVPRIIEAFQSVDEELRQEAARASRYFSDRRLLAYLLDCALDDEPEIRLEAIASLGERAGDDARRALRDLAGSNDRVIADAASEALENARLIDNLDGLQV